MSDPIVETAMRELIAVVEGKIGATATGVHINRGESEDYTRGFNLGYDAADPTVSQPSTPELNAPSDEPWRGAHIHGYEQGFQCRLEHERGEYDIPEWACSDCFGTGMSGSYGPITYTNKDGVVVNSEGFIEDACPTCSGTGSKPILPPSPGCGSGGGTE